MIEPSDRLMVVNELENKGAVRGTGVEVRTKAGKVRRANLSVVKIETDGAPRIMTVIQGKR